MNIVIYNIPKDLEEKAFKSLIRKFCKTKKYIKIYFDHRMTRHFGTYFEFENKRNYLIGHEIKISLSLCGVDSKKSIRIYQYVTTLLHELCHLHQREVLGPKIFYGNNSFNCSKNIDADDNGLYSNMFSKSEVEARTYENKNVLSAVKYYNKVCKNLSRRDRIKYRKAKKHVNLN